MDMIKIINYKDLKMINNKEEFAINIDECDIKLKRRVIDFLCGYVQPNGIMEKIGVNEFIVKK